MGVGRWEMGPARSADSFVRECTLYRRPGGVHYLKLADSAVRAPNVLSSVGPGKEDACGS